MMSFTTFMDELKMRAVAHIKTDFGGKFGIPRQSGLAGDAGGEIIFTPEFRNPDAVRGLEGFSHIWLIWEFSENLRQGWSPTVRPPRLGGNTRMNAVRGMAEIGLNEHSAEEKDQCFAQICADSDNLLSIIKDILDFSKLSSGKYEIADENYTITSLANDIVNIIETRVGEKEIELIVDIDPATPTTLRGDADRIRQIILNLANNAVKFTKEGYVRLAMHTQPDGPDGVTLYAQVQDTGIGIREEDQKNIFNAFVQVDNKYTKAEAGTGLGLAISQQLTALMHGTLTMSHSTGLIMASWLCST